jgi:peptidoglycan/LPS O-acetylase OafA/YrhL
VRYIKGLDAVRAFAIILVIFDHWNDREAYPDVHTLSGFLHHVFVPTGEFGVDMFFVLSGFLITGILLKEKNNETPVGATIKNFFFRRALRIFPIYYLSIALLFLLNYPDIRQNIYWLLSYTENVEVYHHHSWNAFSHAWSLSVEEQFYLLWPWVVLLIPARWLRNAMIAFIAIGVLSKLWVYKVDHGFYYLLVFNCFDAFGLGGLYAYISLKPERMARLSRYLRVLVPVSIAAYFYWKFALYFDYTEHVNFLSRTANSLIALGLVHFVVGLRPDSGYRKLFEHRVLVWVGMVSYGLYLYHYPIDWLYELYVGKIVASTGSSVWTNYYLAYSIKLSLLLAVTSLSYYYFEKPILKMKDRFRYKTLHPKEPEPLLQLSKSSD